MARKQGEHLERDETKIAIIKFMLSSNKEGNNPGILESKIRDYLNDTYEMTAKKSIRGHLKDLSAGAEGPCIEKFPYDKPGKPNYWDITKIKHLSNIKNRFPNIQLNKYKKSLMIVLLKNGYFRGNPVGDQFYDQLRHSSSFFKACVDTNINTLWEGLLRLYAYQKSSENELTEHRLDVCYTAYTYGYPDLKMPYESFVSMIIQISQREERYLLGNFLGTQMYQPETFMKIWEKELLGISNEMSDEMHRETMEDDLQLYSEMAHVASMLKLDNEAFDDMRFNSLFDYYFKQDLFGGVASDEEMEFALKIKYEDKIESMTQMKNEDRNENHWKLDDEYYNQYYTRKKSKKLAKDKRQSP